MSTSSILNEENFNETKINIPNTIHVVSQKDEDPPESIKILGSCFVLCCVIPLIILLFILYPQETITALFLFRH
jgi:hypothetical protein